MISHAGGGSALAALQQGKRPILVPRRAHRGEFRDDHQLEIAELLAGRNLAEHVALETLSAEHLAAATGWVVDRTGPQTPIPIGPDR